MSYFGIYFDDLHIIQKMSYLIKLPNTANQKYTAMTPKSLFLIVFLPIVFIGCNPVYFTHPQPVNSKNSYEFPAKYQGVWMDGEDTIAISKNIYKSVSYRNLNLKKSFADTSSFHVLRNEKIYFVNEEDRSKLTGGFDYSVVNDTIFYKSRDVVEVFLGGTNFLRKVADKHILNIKSNEGWWELVLIEKSKDGSLIGRRISLENLESHQEVKPIWQFESVAYFDVKWTEQELSQLIKAGCFSDTIINLTTDSKIRKHKYAR